MKTFNKTLIALTVAGVLTGVTITALASNTKADSKPFKGVVVEDIVVIEQFPNDVQSGSIQIKDDNETAMAAQALVSASEAAQIATTALPGKVVESQLDEENGYLIWEVEIVDAQGQEAQLKIDAGDGRLLAVEADEDEEHHDGDYEDNDRDERGGEGD